MARVIVLTVLSRIFWLTSARCIVWMTCSTVLAIYSITLVKLGAVATREAWITITSAIHTNSSIAVTACRCAGVVVVTYFPRISCGTLTGSIYASSPIIAVHIVAEILRVTKVSRKTVVTLACSIVADSANTVASHIVAGVVIIATEP